MFHILALKNFRFVLVRIPMNGIFCEKKKKKDSIEYFNTIFKRILLCFQETSNSIKNDNFLCKLTLPNYKIFQEKNGFKYPKVTEVYILLKLLTYIINYMNQFIKNLTNLGKKNIYIR
jgi:hypothetical protein